MQLRRLPNKKVKENKQFSNCFPNIFFLFMLIGIYSWWDVIEHIQQEKFEKQMCKVLNPIEANQFDGKTQNNNNNNRNTNKKRIMEPNEAQKKRRNIHYSDRSKFIRQYKLWFHKNIFISHLYLIDKTQLFTVILVITYFRVDGFRFSFHFPIMMMKTRYSLVTRGQRRIICYKKCEIRPISNVAHILRLGCFRCEKIMKIKVWSHFFSCPGFNMTKCHLYWRWG